MIFEDLLHEAAAVSNPELLIRSGQRFAALLGFETFSITHVKTFADGTDAFNTVHEMPASYMELFHRLDEAKTDPVMQHCKVRHTPICWDQQFYEFAGMAERWEDMSAHGLASGVTSVLHLPCGHHLIAGFDRSGNAPIGAERTDALGKLQLFCAALVEPALAILGSVRASKPYTELTRLEVDALRWATEGKTAFETAVILGLSHSRISKVLASAMQKLDCVTKSQAIVRALRLQLL